MKPIYRSLAAAYGWTYSEIDSHTLPEVNELFSGWDEHTPTHLLVKALVEGFGGGKISSPSPPGSANPAYAVPLEAQAAMQTSVLNNIAAKAGPAMPILRGRDPGLPAKPPSFDLDELRERNLDILRKRAK